MWRNVAWEEIANSGLHGLGAILSLAGLGGLLAVAHRSDGARALIAASLYGLSLVALYSASCLYHGAKALFGAPSLKCLDHIAIYILIAGTYTPFCLVPLWGPLGWGLLAAIWTLALVGIASELWFRERLRVVRVFLYLGMGWLAIVALRELRALLPTASFWSLVAGGVLYTVGVGFFALGRTIPFMHTVWHLFVLGGSACHYLAVLLILPR